MPETTAVSELNPFEYNNLLNAGRARLFARTAETLAEHLEEILSHRLSDCSVRSEPIEQIMLPDTFDPDYDLALLQSSYNLGHGSISTDLGLAMPIVTILLGGVGETPADRRALTRVEVGVIDLILRPVADLACRLFDLGDLQISTHIATAAAMPESPPEPALTIPFHLNVGSLEGSMKIQLAAGLLQTYIEKLDRRIAGRLATRKASPETGILHAIQPIPVEVVVGFDVIRAPAGQLADLEIGDVLRTNQLVSKSLVARVGPERLFNVRAAQRGQRLVAEFISRVNNETGVR